MKCITLPLFLRQALAGTLRLENIFEGASDFIYSLIYQQDRLYLHPSKIVSTSFCFMVKTYTFICPPVTMSAPRELWNFFSNRCLIVKLKNELPEATLFWTAQLKI